MDCERHDLEFTDADCGCTHVACANGCDALRVLEDCHLNPFDLMCPEARHAVLTTAETIHAKRDVYRMYLESVAWKQKARPIKARRCIVCGERSRDAHHTTYERIGMESMDDLVPLCRSCHAAQHGKVA